MCIRDRADIKKELSQNESVLNTEEKLDAQSQQWIDDISEYADIKELDANLLNRLISKIIISEPVSYTHLDVYKRQLLESLQDYYDKKTQGRTPLPNFYAEMKRRGKNLSNLQE